MAFDTVSGAQLMKQLDAFGILVYMQWRIYAICESTFGKVHALDELSRGHGWHNRGEIWIPTITHYPWFLYK